MQLWARGKGLAHFAWLVAGKWLSFALSPTLSVDHIWPERPFPKLRPHYFMHYLHTILQLFPSALRISLYHLPQKAAWSGTCLPLGFVSHSSFWAMATFIIFQVVRLFASLCVPLRNDCQFGCHFLREVFPHQPSLAICLYDSLIKAAFLPVVHEHHEGGTLCV